MSIMFNCLRNKVMLNILQRKKVASSLLFIYDNSMAEQRYYFILSLALIFLIILSSCNAYRWSPDSLGRYDNIITIKLCVE